MRAQTTLMIMLFIFVILARVLRFKDTKSNCTYEGTPISHGDTLMVDECTTCSCDDDTITCDIVSCPAIFCDAPLRFEGECCKLCPYSE